MSEVQNLDQFLNNPSEYFGHSLTRMTRLPREQLDALQLAGVRRRFKQLRPAIPMLDRLARNQNIEQIDSVNDVLPLLFDHATYKSYPAVLLEQHRYTQLTAWLNKLSSHDLSGVDVSGCRSIDEWLMSLSRETPLAVCHTSGTSGTMSFLPWSKAEWRKMFRQYPVMFFQTFGSDSAMHTMPLNMPCIYPYFRSGGMSHTVANDAIVELIAGGEHRFHAAYPQRLSADLMLLGARLRAAAAKGQSNAITISPELQARREEFEALQKEMPEHLARFFETTRVRLRGQRIFLLATSNLLYAMAEAGLKRGVSRIFAPHSVIVTGGGGKGLILPPDWQQTVREYFGVDRLHANYGMSEMAGQFSACEHGHYHGAPWVAPFVLDPDTGRALPRSGTQTGRFAFHDLLPDSRWGGFITGDEVTLAWDTPCPCGRTAPYLTATIQRLSDKAAASGGEDKISCADTAEAYGEALDFLNDAEA